MSSTSWIAISLTRSDTRSHRPDRHQRATRSYTCDSLIRVAFAGLGLGAASRHRRRQTGRDRFGHKAVAARVTPRAIASRAKQHSTRDGSFAWKAPAGAAEALCRPSRKQHFLWSAGAFLVLGISFLVL